MAYDVARVRGLHPSLGDGWVHFDAPSGMLIPDSVATTVSTAFRGSGRQHRRAAPVGASAVPRCWRRPGRRWPIWSTPTRAGVVLGADRAVLLTSLADASSSRAGLGYEVIVTRLDDEANIAPVAARGKPLRRQGEVGRGRHRDRRAADLAVGGPDRQADPSGRDRRRRRRRWAPSPTCGR